MKSPIQLWAVLLAGGALACAVLFWSALRPGISDGPPPKRAFYYWKTRWDPTPGILGGLERNHIGRLYLRFFDVGWDEQEQTTYPVAPLEIAAPLPADVEIVPVVYVVNSVFLKIPYAEVEPLANLVWDKISRMAGEQRLRFRELQLDCDWTDSSQRSYFHFADVLSRKLKGQNMIVSATIRLHQVKYVQRTGIPPVSRGMLMFYNFGRIQADSPRSSIFNEQDAARYASFISSYPMKLDVALPMFSWSVHSREGNVMGLLEQIGTDELESFDGFEKLSPHRYTAGRSFFFHGRYFRKGDLVLVEETTPEITMQAASLAKRGAGRSKSYETVALFDLDEGNLKDYSNAEIENILDRF